MVIPSKTDIVHAFRGEIGRVTIDECFLAIVMLDKRPEVLVLDDCVLKPVGCLGNQIEHFPHIEGLTAVCLSTAGVAVSKQFHVHRGTTNIIITVELIDERFEFFCLSLIEHLISQCQLFRMKGVHENPSSEKLLNAFELFSGIEISDTKLTDQCQRSFLDASEKDNEIDVKVVVDLEGRRIGISQQDASGASEYIDKAGILEREQSIQDMKN